MRVFICVACGIFCQFSGTSLTGYYLSTILTNIGYTDPRYQTRLNGFITLSNMFQAWFWCLWVDKIGRQDFNLFSYRRTSANLCSVVPSS